MMKNIIMLGVFALALVLVQCSSNTEASLDNAITNNVDNLPSAKGKTITFQGTIVGGGGLGAYFDAKKINEIEMISETTINGNGTFKLAVENLKAGLYRLRIGEKEITLVLDGTEDVVDINANLSTVKQLDLEIKGSKTAEEYLRIFKEFIQNSPTAEDFANYIDTTSIAMTSYAMATEILNPKRFQLNFLSPERIIEIHSRANTKLAEAHPNSELIPMHQAFMEEIKVVLGQQMVRVGSTPPDIALNSPSGKTYELSELKGKVVLLDFWASWCRPCRINNPELVRIYKKYKDQGFTVYSVSLDRRAQAWQQAIIQDGLEWEYHVSDLKYWQSQPAKMYGVTGIPFTYLLDKQGKIAAINPRSPQLEQAVQRLL